jgi:transposase
MTNQVVLTQAEKRALRRRVYSNDPGLSVVHPDAAGIDIGCNEHYVAVTPGRDSEPVKSFGCFTADLEQMADWLHSCGVKSIVMQSTGFYWIPVYDLLEKHGFEVWLVNARETRNPPGRKSDVQESQWLLKLHTYGLLRPSFRPSEQIREVRTYWRTRGNYVRQATTAIQHMQKALTEMNLRLTTVLSDISGVTGMRIIRAIVAGERDPHRLAAFRDKAVKASVEQIVRSLEGTWKSDQLDILELAVGDLDHIEAQLGKLDKKMAQAMAAAPSAPVQPLAPGGKKKKRNRKKASTYEPAFGLEAELKRLAGVDLTAIDGVHVMTVQTVFAETGFDMSPWANEHRFVSWLGLAPCNDVSGGKVLRKRTKKVVSRLATALRIAATTLLRSNTYLGAQYRRLRARLGPPKGITAMAAKLARLIYRMLKYGHHYVDKGMEHYEQNYKAQQLRRLNATAKANGFALVPLHSTLNPLQNSTT